MPPKGNGVISAERQPASFRSHTIHEVQGWRLQRKIDSALAVGKLISYPEIGKNANSVSPWVWNRLLGWEVRIHQPLLEDIEESFSRTNPAAARKLRTAVRAAFSYPTSRCPPLS